MKRSTTIILTAILFSLIPGISPGTGAWGKDVIHRYAIVIGANDGGPSRIKLKYAVSDAGQFMSVLNNLGGVPEENSLLLYDPDIRNFISAFRKIRRSITEKKSSSRRVEFFFYYSGHSDEEGVLLGREKLSYKKIKKSLEYIPADFRIAILDSCSSGAFTQVKGGQKKPPFLFDESHNMKGNAILTSSSSDEVSQESDRIKGSFFTHYLVTGLRGAADVTQDSRITLNEAYQFAYSETLSRTEKTLSGPQHPNYNIQMTGTGDVILTDIRKGAVKLVLAMNLSGKFFINDSEEILVSEFRKAYGRTMSIGLERGSYSVVNQRGDGIYQAEINLRGSGSHYLTQKNFSRGTREETVARGETSRKEKKSVLITDFSTLSRYDFSGYGAAVVSFGKAGNTMGTYVGGKAGVIINRQFVFGGGGYGLVSTDKREEISGDPYTGDKPHVSLGYGGAMFEYFFSPSSLFHTTAGIMIGGGGLGVMEKNDTAQDTDISNDAFFYLEPDINLSLNVTWFFRMSVGVSYRYIYGLKFHEFSDSDFRGFNGRIALSFGLF